MPPRYREPTSSSKSKERSPFTPNLETSFSLNTKKTTSSISSDAGLSVVSASTNESTDKLFPKVDHNKFRSAICDLYGLHILTNIQLASPFEHFSTKDPEKEKDFRNNIPSWYQQAHSNCHIWHALDSVEAARHAKQYRKMTGLRENEAKFSHHGKSYFFKEDDLPDQHETEPISKAYFKLEWGPTPDDDRHLRRPPVVCDVADGHSTHTLFDFNSNPDCSYWLTVQQLNPEYRDLTQDFLYVVDCAKVTCPYLTIEFKKERADFKVAENRIAAAAALTLYNRFLLRCERLQKFGHMSTSLTQDDFKDVKHYGIAFDGAEASFYLVYPNLSFGGPVPVTDSSLWQGCTLTKLIRHNAISEDSVLKIERWINEIHNWGPSQHSYGVATDIKGILYKIQEPESRDRVSLDTNEMKALGL